MLSNSVMEPIFLQTLVYYDMCYFYVLVYLHSEHGFS